MQSLNLDIFHAFHAGWALVTAGTADDFNTMTVSWGGLGTLWNKSVATVYIRPSRHTDSYLEQNEIFTVSFFPERYRQDLTLLGTVSGRDGDKLAKTGLTPVSLGGGMGFAQASCTLVCKKLYRQTLDAGQIPAHVLQSFYGSEPIHKMYIGEVLEVITTPESAG